MNRIIQNWITSLIGLLIILATLYFYFMDKSVDWAQSLVQIAVGFLLLRLKDALLWKMLFKLKDMFSPKKR